jgi:ABC-type uncharacterized transport system permease subunit
LIIIPVGVAITIPTEALLNGLELKTLVTSLLICIVLVGLSRIVWNLGIRKYSGASS